MIKKFHMKPFTSLKFLADYQQFQIFILGMFSGMPLFIIYSTLTVWMKDNGIDIAIITTLAAARIFYSLKVFWAPLVDQIQIPILCKMGRRKSWIFLISGFIAYVIWSYSYLDPKVDFSMIFFSTMLLGFASSTLDIVIDAYRIDSVPKEKQALAAANVITGYRLGGIIAVAGALFYADNYEWSHVFMFIGGLYVFFMFYILTFKEPENLQPKFVINSFDSWKRMTIYPFYDFFKRDGALLILAAIIFFKLGDAMLGVIAMPFYIDLGYTKTEISAVIKLYGAIATISGAYLGGIVLYRIGLYKGILICGLAQSLTNFAFVWLNHQDHNIYALMTAISIENIASGMGDAALIGYLSYLCSREFSATQYAMFSSSSGLFSHSIVVYGGTILKAIGYDAYFVMTVILAFPGLALFYILNKKYGVEKQ